MASTYFRVQEVGGVSLPLLALDGNLKFSIFLFKLLMKSLRDSSKKGKHAYGVLRSSSQFLF